MCPLCERQCSLPCSCRVAGAHQKFKEKIGALAVTYHESVQSLIVLSQTEGPVELAGLLIDMHFRNLRTKGLLTSHNEETSRRLEVGACLLVCLSVYPSILGQPCPLVSS